MLPLKRLSGWLKFPYFTPFPGHSILPFYAQAMNASGLELSHCCAQVQHIREGEHGLWKGLLQHFGSKSLCSRSATVKAKCYKCNNTVKLSLSPWWKKQSRRKADLLVFLHPHLAHPQSKSSVSFCSHLAGGKGGASTPSSPAAQIHQLISNCFLVA